MAGTKISALTAGAALGGTEALPAVQSAATVKITADQIKTFTSASPTLVTPVLGVATGTSLTLSNGTSIAPVLVGGSANSGFYFANSGTDVGYVRAGSPMAVLGFQKIVQSSLGVFGFAPSTDPTATPDTGLSRISAGVIGVGTGAQGSVAGGLQAATLALGGATIGSNALAVTGGISNSSTALLAGGGFVARSDGQSNLYDAGRLGWTSAATGDTSADLILTRGAAATLQHGAADAASPVAQTIKFQDVVAGTSNTAGVNATIQAPAGTGTGAGGSLIFQVAPAGSSGTAKNAWATALTIASDKSATFTGNINLGAANWIASFGRGGIQLAGDGVFEIFSTGYASNVRITAGASNLATFNGGVAATTFLKSGSYTVATVPSASSSGASAHIYVSDETGGATPAFSDATNWRRYADRAIIS